VVRRRPADVLAGTPYARTLGVELAAVRPGHATLRLPHRDDNGNRNGTLHGGVLASLIDMAAAIAAAAPDGSRRHEGSTIDLAVHYLAPARREAVTAEGVVARRGREIAFVSVAVSGESGVPVARGLVARRLATAARLGERGAAKAPLDDVVADAHFAARTSGSPFTRRLHVRVARLGPGRAAALLPHDPTTTDHTGRVHEGALASLVDCAGGASAWSVAGFDPRGRAATVSMHLTFDVTPRDEDVVAMAETSWHAGTLLVNTVTLHGRTSGRAVATGSVTYRIVRPGA
jgi:uncharacterized protein (TIGR00369 family)